MHTGRVVHVGQRAAEQWTLGRAMCVGLRAVEWVGDVDADVDLVDVLLPVESLAAVVGVVVCVVVVAVVDVVKRWSQ